MKGCLIVKQLNWVSGYPSLITRCTIHYVRNLGQVSKSSSGSIYLSEHHEIENVFTIKNLNYGIWHSCYEGHFYIPVIQTSRISFQKFKNLVKTSNMKLD